MHTGESVWCEEHDRKVSEDDVLAISGSAFRLGAAGSIGMKSPWLCGKLLEFMLDLVVHDGQ